MEKLVFVVGMLSGVLVIVIMAKISGEYAAHACQQATGYECEIEWVAKKA